MKSLRNIFVLLLTFIFSQSFSQNTILWEITGNGVTAPSYLMGTLKFIGEKEFTIPKEAEQHLKKCKIFAIEDQVDHHAQHELNKAVHFPSGQSLKTALSPEDYTKVQQFFSKEFSISQKAFDDKYAKLIPLALSMTMTRLSLGEDVKFYDIELLKLAKKSKLQTYSLEEIHREAQAIKKFPMDEQAKALIHSIDNFEQQKTEFRKMTSAYPFEDTKEIFEYTLHPIENNPTFVEEFYTKRNLEWLPKIEKMVHDKPAFIALGVSHLEGEQGMLKLLRDKGYTLTPVTLSR